MRALSRVPNALRGAKPLRPAFVKVPQNAEEWTAVLRETGERSHTDAVELLNAMDWPGYRASGGAARHLDHYHAALRSLAKHVEPMMAIQCLSAMKANGVTPTEQTYRHVLQAASFQHLVTDAVLMEMIEDGIMPRASTYDIVKRAYRRCDCPEDAVERVMDSAGVAPEEGAPAFDDPYDDTAL